MAAPVCDVVMFPSLTQLVLFFFYTRFCSSSGGHNLVANSLRAVRVCVAPPERPNTAIAYRVHISLYIMLDCVSPFSAKLIKWGPCPAARLFLHWLQNETYHLYTRRSTAAHCVHAQNVLFLSLCLACLSCLHALSFCRSRSPLVCGAAVAMPRRISNNALALAPIAQTTETVASNAHNILVRTQ